MSVCIACIPSKLLTNEEMLVSHDYCKECIKVINDDLDEFKNFLESRRNKHENP